MIQRAKLIRPLNNHLKKSLSFSTHCTEVPSGEITFLLTHIELEEKSKYGFFFMLQQKVFSFIVFI